MKSAELDAIDAIVDASALRAAIALWREGPWRTVVVGRRSTGKTSCVNHHAGTKLPIGLGGVTKAVAEVETAGAVWIDTPGIEDVDEAADVLEPVLIGADVVLWLVDGLQPVTDLERRVLREVLPDGTALRVAVTRLDLVDVAEHEAVLSRVQTVTASLRPMAVGTLDPRTQSVQTAAASAGSLRRRQALQRAITQTRAAIRALPEAPEPTALGRTLQQRWRTAVRDAERRVQARIQGDRLVRPADALASLARAAEQAVADVQAQASLPGSQSRTAATAHPTPPRALQLESPGRRRCVRSAAHGQGHRRQLARRGPAHPARVAGGRSGSGSRRRTDPPTGGAGLARRVAAQPSGAPVGRHHLGIGGHWEPAIRRAAVHDHREHIVDRCIDDSHHLALVGHAVMEAIRTERMLPADYREPEEAAEHADVEHDERELEDPEDRADDAHDPAGGAHAIGLHPGGPTLRHIGVAHHDCHRTEQLAHHEAQEPNHEYGSALLAVVTHESLPVRLAYAAARYRISPVAELGSCRDAGLPTSNTTRRLPSGLPCPDRDIGPRRRARSRVFTHSEPQLSVW